MNTFRQSLAVALAFGLSLSAPVAAQDEDEKATDLQSYSVGERRPTVNPEAVTIERPKIETSFKLDIPKPVLSDVQMARPSFQVLEEPAAAKATTESTAPTRTADSGGAAPTVNPAGGPTQPVRPLRMDPPEYPRDAYRRRQEGFVVVEFTINTQGGTEDISVVEAQPRGAFDAEARRAVARWTFTPAMRDGRPVPQRIRHTLEFTLTGK